MQLLAPGGLGSSERPAADTADASALSLCPVTCSPLERYTERGGVDAMVYHGTVKGGAIVLDPGVKLPDGATVRVEFDPPEGSPSGAGDDPLLKMVELAVETGIPDLATNADHYLYGHPKASDAG